MKKPSISLFMLGFVACLVGISVVGWHSAPESQSSATPSFAAFAPTPPMGWNSFDAYDCRINEDEFKAHVDFMAENLSEFGWEYAVMDYIWWHPEPGNWETPRRHGHPNIRYQADGSALHPEYITIDEHGRLQPSVERFPSSANGKGFKPLADYVHSKGLKFGLHIMRGVHRVANQNSLNILHTELNASQIAEPWDTCMWCNHMYGVDPTKPGAQAYYDALFEMYAEWGVDYIKADDMIFPKYHKGELEMIRKAIDRCGRPMVLSLSPGEAPLSQANHLSQHANMWRISADFWDDWDKLQHNFDLLNAWSPHIQPGRWPDADMLPIGHISMDNRPHGPDRMSNFTWPEHYTLMTLWCMARSPLMMGGDLLSTPDSVIQLLQNPEVLAVNQHSVDNRQVFKRDTEAGWFARDSRTGDPYIALFNLSDEERTVSFELEWEYLRESYQVRDLWKQQDLGISKESISMTLPPHGAGIYRLTKTSGGVQ
ncbi:glycoside hydrolase family 27 protein [Pontibacter sp. G13]|uniref:glycoside hydrolase family 27 protein n=1 Tax=Pontibacter sp. G13 TaxID=3074898 RepID=UPI00288B0010|nr:glycoside hydrolase family 27 protein [Pontibacter sp. G13]WNJ19144.1 glycoside hydrolase family 27 protein [Pontibacter sp. G13]